MRLGIALVAMVLLAIVSLRSPVAASGGEPLAQQAAASPASRSVWDGVYTPAQAKRGALKSGLCTSCHGDSFEGLLGPALAGPAFTEKWQGRTVGDLFDLMRLTMPDDAPGSLAREEYADLLAYILAVNKYPSGKTEIGTDAGPLKEIRIEPARR
jgi:mono/diheme cytochrome c family protein